MKVEFDNSLNKLGWDMYDFLSANGQVPNAFIFNNMKTFLRAAIQEWVDSHKKELVQAFYEEAMQEVEDKMKAKE